MSSLTSSPRVDDEEQLRILSPNEELIDGIHESCRFLIDDVVNGGKANHVVLE